MASVAPGQRIETVGFALTGATATTVYTVGDKNEQGIYLTGVTVVDATGAISTAARLAWVDAGTEYVLVPATVGLPTPTENLEFVCEPAMRLMRGDLVRVTGANGHHVIVSFVIIGIDTGVQAQTKPGDK